MADKKIIRYLRDPKDLKQKAEFFSGILFLLVFAVYGLFIMFFENLNVIQSLGNTPIEKAFFTILWVGLIYLLCEGILLLGQFFGTILFKYKKVNKNGK